ncbi:MAG TPA: hypothetical protein VKE40_18295 [Gemmataceae bacterium]|nr:hypothetical protein [Gemmataceae bacterium]
MRLRSVPLTAAAVAACSLWSLQPSAADPVPLGKEKPAAAKPASWQDDPVCQMVFFAVLEGLYTDGVPAEVVDSIVPPTKEGDDSVKTSFVIECPLCHPVYEAFRLYQQRKPFADAPKRDTFGKGIDPELVKKLKSATPITRLTALKVLVQNWVERRLTMMRLTEDEKRDWTAKIGERGSQGRGQLTRRLASDPDYKGWSLYWGCAACNGSEGACSLVKPAGKKE